MFSDKCGTMLYYHVLDQLLVLKLLFKIYITVIGFAVHKIK